MVHKMNFISQNSAQPGLTTSIASELNSIGCEAWIDVGRFGSREKSLSAVTADPRASQSSLRKSVDGLRRRFQRRTPEDLD
jgi:hypothetical protein